MKKQLLQFMGMMLFAASANAQVTISKTLPPVGTKFKLKQHASTSITKPSIGADQVWDYNALNFTSLADYEIIAPTSVKQQYQDSCPTAKYVELMELPGAPSQDYKPMNFFTDNGDYLIQVGTKGSNLNCEKRLDTILQFNLAYQSTAQLTVGSVHYAGYGTLKVGGKEYTNVVLFQNTRTTSNDTMYQFYQFTPHMQRLLGITWSGSTGASTGAALWEPQAGTSGISKYTNNIVTAVYPNPASSAVIINISGVINQAAITVTDVQGKVLLVQHTQQQQTALNIASLKNGIYFLRIENNGEQAVQKFIKH